jgi:hypothetical protein
VARVMTSGRVKTTKMIQWAIRSQVLRASPSLLLLLLSSSSIEKGWSVVGVGVGSSMDAVHRLSGNGRRKRHV